MKTLSKTLFFISWLFLTGAVISLQAQTSLPEKAAAGNKSVYKGFSQLVRAKYQNTPFVLLTPADLSKIPEAELNRLLSAQGLCDTAVSISTGQIVNGQLSSGDCLLEDGSYADFYSFNGTQGQQLTISLASNDFDSYLGLAYQDGSFVVEDDDGGGGLNSKIMATLPTTGLYIILANSALPNQFGNYTLGLTAATVCTYSLEPSSANVPAAGGMFSFRVNTQPGCYWSASTTDYYFLSTSSSGTGPGTVEYRAAVSPYSTDRTGKIFVGGLVFTVTQPPLVCTYSISQTSLAAPATGAAGTFRVTTPDGCPWTANASGYFIWSDNYGRGTTDIRYTVSTNNGADRVGKITVNGLDFTITQPGLNCTFAVSTTVISVDRYEHTGTISVDTQPGCYWSVLGGGWITLQNTVGTGPGAFSYRLYANSSFGNRTDVIGFYGLDLIRIYVAQAGIPYRTRFDFDGDSKADFSVFRPDNGVWYQFNSQTGFTATQFGLSTDKLAPADYDGDRKTDIAIFREGVWYLQKSTQGFAAVQFGSSGDIPVPADYDGDGKAELAVYRPSNGTWYTLNLVNNNFNAVQFGVSEDKPVVGDYDGDGKSDYAVYRPTGGMWYLMQSTKGFSAIQFGNSTDKPVVGDYDGDGRADQAVYRPSNGTWYLYRSLQGITSVQFGFLTDLPTPADYDGDGKTDIAVFRPDSGNWYVMKSAEGFGSVQFGLTGDKPAPNAFVQ